MQCIMNGRNKNVTLSTLLLIAKGFDMPIVEFFNDEIFSSEEIELDV